MMNPPWQTTRTNSVDSLTSTFGPSFHPHSSEEEEEHTPQRRSPQPANRSPVHHSVSNRSSPVPRSTGNYYTPISTPPPMAMGNPTTHAHNNANTTNGNNGFTFTPYAFSYAAPCPYNTCATPPAVSCAQHQSSMLPTNDVFPTNSIVIPDFDMEDFVQSERALLRWIVNKLHTASGSGPIGSAGNSRGLGMPGQRDHYRRDYVSEQHGSVSVDQLRIQAQREVHSLYSFVVGAEYGNKWTKFLRKHNDMFEFIDSGKNRQILRLTPTFEARYNGIATICYALQLYLHRCGGECTIDDFCSSYSTLVESCNDDIRSRLQFVPHASINRDIVLQAVHLHPDLFSLLRSDIVTFHDHDHNPLNTVTSVNQIFNELEMTDIPRSYSAPEHWFTSQGHGGRGHGSVSPKRGQQSRSPSKQSQPQPSGNAFPIHHQPQTETNPAAIAVAPQDQQVSPSPSKARASIRLRNRIASLVEVCDVCPSSPKSASSPQHPISPTSAPPALSTIVRPQSPPPAQAPPIDVLVPVLQSAWNVPNSLVARSDAFDQLREDKLVNTIVEFLTNPKSNPLQGPVASERIQNCIKVACADLYKAVVGSHYGNHWHRFILAHTNAFILFKEADSWFVRLPSHQNWRNTLQQAIRERVAKRSTLKSALIRFLRTRPNFSCTMDEFVAVAPDLMERSEIGPSTIPRGNVSKVVKKNPNVFGFDSTTYTITLLNPSSTEHDNDD